jgi:hypothetical protein
MSCAGWTTVQVTFRRRARGLGASRRRRNGAVARRKRFEDRIEMSNDFRLAANHLAVAAFESPHAAARADVNVMNSLVF